MNRREFVAKSCVACLGAATLSTTLSSCASARYSKAALEGSGLTIPKSEFTSLHNGETVARPFVIVTNDKLDYPIYVFRISEGKYAALWMKCTHQGGELEATGNLLTCPDHGSEFDQGGNVTHGPAKKPLRRFPVSDRGETLFIDMA